MKPLSKVAIRWSPDFSYAIGLLATDGNLSSDGRHISFTSKDRALVETFKKCLCIHNIIGEKSSGSAPDRKYYHVQIGDVIFYRWLLGIGLTPRKSKTIGTLAIPDKYFADFIRGHFDGDGSFYVIHDTRWRSSYMFYTSFTSASLPHLQWLRSKLNQLINIKGHVVLGKRAWMLRYAKAETRKLVTWLYYKKTVPCLERKRVKMRPWIDFP